MNAHLFDPIDLRGVHVPNRIIVSPMGMHSAVEGVAGDWHLMHLGQFAISGAGLVITEAVAVTPEGRVSPFDLGLWNDEQRAALKRITSFAATYGARASEFSSITPAARLRFSRRSWVTRRSLRRRGDGHRKLHRGLAIGGATSRSHSMNRRCCASAMLSWRRLGALMTQVSS